MAGHAEGSGRGKGGGAGAGARDVSDVGGTVAGGPLEETDVVVIGGGPGGSTAAALIARDGHRVVLLERAEFPRYQIGESLLPSTVHGVCALLGVEDKVLAAGFTRKRGGTFHWGANPEPWTFRFSDSGRFPGADYALQVERSKFDHILLEHAQSVGVDVRQRHQVVGVLTEAVPPSRSERRVCGVRYENANGVRKVLRARFVIDASGRRGVVAQPYGGRTYDAFFRNMALFTYFEGAKQLTGERAGNILTAAFSGGWFWAIPLTPELTSVGVVVPHEMQDKIRKLGQDAFYQEMIEACPPIAKMLGDAQRVESGQYAPLRMLRDYSYLSDRFWVPGALFVGDACCFVDPVLSSGVHLATHAGMLAARTVNSSLADEALEVAACKEFELRYRREYALFYQFLLGFYEMHEDLDSYFWRAHKLLEGSQDLDPRAAFSALVGGVGGTDEPVFQSVESFVEGATRRAHIMGQMTAPGAAQSGRATGANDPGRKASADLDDAFFRERQELALLRDLKGGVKDKECLYDAVAPLVTNGLVPSPDGLRWCTEKAATDAATNVSASSAG